MAKEIPSVGDLRRKSEITDDESGARAQPAGNLFKKVLLSLGRMREQADEVPAPTSEAR